MALKVLVIEDEIKLLKSIQSNLISQSIQVDVATNGDEGFDLAMRNKYNVIISDILMPHSSGIDFIEKLRKQNNHTPVIFLSALNHTKDKIEGLEAGADDYLAKPFEFKELLLRIKALARRTEVEKTGNEEKLYYKDIVLNYNTREAIRTTSNFKIPLTPKEFLLLEYFLKNPERVISRNELAEKVWNINFDTGTNIVEVYVNFLRKKIDIPNHSKLIHTVFKTGYILRVEQNADTH